MKKHLLSACFMLILAANGYAQNIRVPYRLYAKWGYADLSGKLVIPARYDNVFRFNEECAIVKLKGKYGVIDSAGKLLLPVIYDDIDSKKWKGKTWYIPRTGKQYGLANTAGKLIMPVKYDRIKYEKNGPYAVAITGKSLFMITPEGMVQKGTQANDIKEEEQRISGEPRKDFFRPFSQNNKSGYLVNWGRDTIPAIYDAIDEINIYDNVLRVKKDGFWGVIGPKNNIVFPFLYEEMGNASPAFNLYAGKKNGKYGILKPNGEVLVPFEWDRLSFANDGYWCMVNSNGKNGIIILDGSTPVLIPARYKSIPGNPAEVYQSEGRKVRFYAVETTQGYGYVREDGVEYFKDK